MISPYPIFVAVMIWGLLSKPLTEIWGREFLKHTIKASRRSPFAREVRREFNKLTPKDPTMAGISAEVIKSLDSLDSTQRNAALSQLIDWKMSGSPLYEEAQDIYYGEVMGWGLPNPLKKAAKAIEKAAKKAAKKVAKHDFTKDIEVLNKVGKIVGPIAASAPPPYGPAIAGACLLLDSADKFNKGAIDQIDTAGLMDAAGVEAGPEAAEILKTAQTIRNNIKATDLIAAVSKGDVGAITKMKGIKEAAKMGNSVAKSALSALKSATLGAKISPADKAEIVRKTIPRGRAAKAIMKSSRVITTPSGREINILSTHQHGTAMLLQIATAG